MVEESTFTALGIDSLNIKAALSPKKIEKQLDETGEIDILVITAPEYYDDPFGREEELRFSQLKTDVITIAPRENINPTKDAINNKIEFVGEGMMNGVKCGLVKVNMALSSKGDPYYDRGSVSLVDVEEGDYLPDDDRSYIW